MFLKKSKPLASAVILTALAFPAASAADVDLRNPDSRSAAIASERADTYLDLRNPDSRGPAVEVETAVPETPSPVEAQATSSGFDWGDAGIGAGAVLGLLLIGISVVFTVSHRRNRALAT